MQVAIALCQTGAVGFLLWGAVLCMSYWTPQARRHMFDEAGPRMSRQPG